jgi:hypothetical protein
MLIIAKTGMAGLDRSAAASVSGSMQTSDALLAQGYGNGFLSR